MIAVITWNLTKSKLHPQEIKSRLNSGNSSYQSAQNLLFSCLQCSFSKVAVWADKWHCYRALSWQTILFLILSYTDLQNPGCDIFSRRNIGLIGLAYRTSSTIVLQSGEHVCDFRNCPSVQSSTQCVRNMTHTCVYRCGHSYRTPTTKPQHNVILLHMPCYFCHVWSSHCWTYLFSTNSSWSGCSVYVQIYTHFSIYSNTTIIA
jgi:hypothetical protein